MRLSTITLLATTLLPAASYAALGSAPSSGMSSTPAAVRALQQASAAATTTTSYSMRESFDANGVAIREYVLPSNIVFAVTWKGPVRPDMSALLGSYFPNYLTAGAARPRGTGVLNERQGDLRIESAGRPGHLFGIAYLPRLMPSSVRAADLR